MQSGRDYGKIVLTFFFLVMIGMIGIKSHPIQTCKKVVQEFKSLNTVEEEFVDSIWLKDSFIDLSGMLARSIKMHGFYSNLGIYVTDDYYIVGKYPATTTDYEYEQMMDFKNLLDEKGINLLYVNAPIKYVDDDFFMDEFGLTTYGNRNADVLLQRMSDSGINCIDLREHLKEGMNIYDMFYRTDHHWITESGLWATQIIAEGLNENCGYHIDTSMYDDSNYTFIEYKNCWLGEQGRKLSVSYVGLDDYTLIKPKFDTNLIVTTVGIGTREGLFDIMIDETSFDMDMDVYDSPSWHYAYLRDGVSESVIHNKNVQEGKVLVLADSYSQVVIPFLSLGVSDVTTLVLRNYKGSLREFIDANEFDTVVILYAQSMIGAHDNPASANYDMYMFE